MKTKKLLCALFAVVMVFALLPAMTPHASAETPTASVEFSGQRFEFYASDHRMEVVQLYGTAVDTGTSSGTNLYSFLSQYAKSTFKLVIGEGFTTIDSYAFNNQWDGRYETEFPNLSSVTLPSTMLEIKAGAFYRTPLTSITLPSSLTHIGAYAFFATKLSSVTFPASIRRLDEKSFGFTDTLKTISFLGDAPTIDDYAFHGLEATVNTPSGNSTWTAEKLKDYGGTLTWNNPVTPVVTKQPVGVSARYGDEVELSVEACGGNLEYQWQMYLGPKWLNIPEESGGTRPLYYFDIDLGLTGSYTGGGQYRCKISNSAGTTYSDTVTVEVDQSPVIIKQPKDCTVNEGGSASFTVDAIGKGRSYQWYCRSSSTGSWVACGADSAKTATHTPAALPKYSGYQYKCVITNDAGSVTSDIVTLTVVSKPTITAQPKNCTVAEGGSASFTVKASGATSYQWYCRSSSTGSWVKCQAASAKTATHTPAALPKYSGYQYKCVISRTVNGVTASVTSNIVTLTVISKPVITTQPANQTVNAGKTATFKVTATGADLSYQWYYQKPGESAWTKVSVNGTSATYKLTTAARHNGYKYKCVVSRTASGVTASVTSNIVTLTVKSTPVITTQPTNQTVVEGSKATFKVVATGAASYQWYYQKPGSEAWTKVSSNGTSATYTLTTAARHNGYKYKCVVTNASGSTTSSVVTLTVISKPVITTQPKNVSVTAGNTATFKVAATGGGLSYQWWYLKPGTTTWVKVSSNGTSATYKLTTAARHNGYRYKCVVTNSAGSATSSIVTLTVK